MSDLTQREWPKCEHGVYTHLACPACGRAEGPHMNHNCDCKACVELRAFVDSAFPDSPERRTPSLPEGGDDEATALRLMEELTPEMLVWHEGLDGPHKVSGSPRVLEIIARHLSRVRADEREVCAKIAFNGNGSDPADCAHNIAKQIRASRSPLKPHGGER